MCGLTGALSLNTSSTISTKLFLKNFVEMDSRGGDSIGWCVAMKDEMQYWKQCGFASQHRQDIKTSIFGCRSIIGHTRYATHGDIKEEDNNHPHMYSNENVVGAVTHNGVIGDHKTIAKDNGVTLKGECDSEIIARLVEDSNSNLSMPLRIANAVNECDDTDSIALSVLETGDGNVDLCLVARGNPIWYSHHNGVIYYASTKCKLPNAAIKLDEGCILHARQHVGILNVFSGLMTKYSAHYNKSWRTCGIGYTKPIAKNTSTEIAYNPEYDSFDDWIVDRSVV